LKRGTESAQENVGKRRGEHKKEGRKEEGNERAEGLVIRRKEMYCKEEKDGGRKDRKRV
jgi:hypothetical protein